MLLFAAAVFAQDTKPQLSKEVIDVWNGLRGEASAVSDKACSGEITQAFQSAMDAYSQFGLSQPFLSSVLNIGVVAGDIPEAEKFRSDFANLTQSIKIAYQGVATAAVQQPAPVEDVKPAETKPSSEPKQVTYDGVLASNAETAGFALAVVAACGLLL